jgi:hypothetical protein
MQAREDSKDVRTEGMGEMQRNTRAVFERAQKLLSSLV